jgi:glycosyltransferase involved in cell wall biosynthesis
MIKLSGDRTAVAGQLASPPALVNVLHLINGEHYSGAERVQDLLGLALPACGYAVGFVALKPGRFAGSRRSVDCPLYQLPMRSRWDIGIARRIAAICREGGFKLLHAHTPRSLLVATRVARLTGLPLVYHVHSPVGRDCGSWWKNRVNTWLESLQLRRCDHMICVSGSLHDYMLGLGHPPEKLSVVRNGVPCLADRDRRWTTGERSGWTLGTVALFRPRKGLEVLLDAIARIRDRRPGLKLLAVGPFESSAYEAAIRDQVARLGLGDLIEWTGFEQQVDQRLRQMDALVLPSLYGEGLPMVVLEAMAAGVPVVATRVEGVPEALRDGVDGLICEAGNAVDLAAKLLAITADRSACQVLGESARQRQREHLSDASMARGVAAVYDQLL